MAEMSLDELLSSSIKGAAEPAASAGVADAIRSRVAAGDTGTSVAGNTAPGWGGGASGILTVVAPIALIVVAGAVGGVLGVTGVFGSTRPQIPDGNIPAYVVTSDVATAFTCPGGASIDNIPANTRVLAVVRDDDIQWLGVRDPDDVERTLWVAAADVVLDKGSPDPSTLPVDGCPEATVTLPQPVVTQEPTEPTSPPSNNPQPPPPSDTTAPTVDKTTASPAVVQTCNGNGAIIKTNATDNVAVVGVTVFWSGAAGGSAQMAPTGGVGWQYNLVPTSGASGPITVVVTARDAAGHTGSQQTGFTTTSCVFG